MGFVLTVIKVIVRILGKKVFIKPAIVQFL